MMAAVVSMSQLTPHMARIHLQGDDLTEMEPPQPAASVRLFTPFPGSNELPSIVWNGNAYRLADGTRPLIRTFTPLHFDSAAGRLDLDVVLHEAGATTRWLEMAQPGDPVAVSGPGRGYTIDPEPAGYLLAGDESALPAIRQVIEAIAPDVVVRVVVEVGSSKACQELPFHPGVDTKWAVRLVGAEPGSALLPALRAVEVDNAVTAWAAGEAGAMFHVRKYLLEECSLDRRRVTVRGYWKVRAV
jgi:NADPH-dependent ferric siderophore reductase